VDSNAETVAIRDHTKANGSDEKTISDPEILEAIMASLKDAEDALGNTSSIDDDENDHSLFESVEITKMTVPTDNNMHQVSDGFVFSDPDTANTDTVAMGKKRGRKGRKAILRNSKKGQGDKLEDDAPLPKNSCGRPRKFVDRNDNYTVDESLSFSDEEDYSKLPKGDTDYKPGRKKAYKNTRVDLRKTSREHGFTSGGFNCEHCKFVSNSLGLLKIHSHNIHEECEAPSYLDMAEATIAQVDEGYGVEESSIFKEVLFEHFDIIADDKKSAAVILKTALKEGVKLGRLLKSRKGRGRDKFKLVARNEMKKVLEKWRVDKKSVEFINNVTTSKKRVMKMKPKNSIQKVGGGKTIVRYLSENASDLKDEDVVVLQENLTFKTWAKKKASKIKQEPKPLVFENLPQSFIPQHPDSLVEEENDPSTLTCSVCLFSFWYQQETLKHMDLEHSKNEMVQDANEKGRFTEREVGDDKCVKIICDVDLPVEDHDVSKGGVDGLKSSAIEV